MDYRENGYNFPKNADLYLFFVFTLFPLSRREVLRLFEGIQFYSAFT